MKDLSIYIDESFFDNIASDNKSIGAIEEIIGYTKKFLKNYQSRIKQFGRKEQIGKGTYPYNKSIKFLKEKFEQIDIRFNITWEQDWKTYKIDYNTISNYYPRTNHDGWVKYDTKCPSNCSSSSNAEEIAKSFYNYVIDEIYYSNNPTMHDTLKYEILN